MSNRKTWLIIAGVVAVALVGWLIYQAYVPKEEIIKIGAILPLTGDLSSYGVDTRKALEMAVEELNARGGIDGRRLMLVAEDSRGSSATAVSAFSKLVDVDRVYGVLGPITSAEVLSVAPVANSKRVPIISPSATSPDITDAGDYVFRTINADIVETEAFAAYVRNELNVPNAGIIALDAAGTLSYANSFESFFTKLGGSVVSKEIVSEAATEYRTPVRKILDNKPAAIYVSGYSKEIGQIVKQIREMDKKVMLLSYQSAEDNRVVQIAGVAVDGMIFSSTTLPEGTLGEKNKQFINNFKDKFGKEPGVFTAEIYDGLYVLAEAIRRCAGNRDKLLEELRKTSGHSGASGTITFDKNGDVHKPIAVYRYVGTEINPIKVLQ